ncbi:hypothetical protein OQZ55_18610 [Bacillus subtilis]|uniref:hypothetical protein n=1 Tax=Bacillus subtilis TaxID=1423 RepID=UPI001E4EEE04|nr:hypothetical protein [Bacillus subtilis]MCT6511970.1 hypothetical protein [Bacillus subtilis]MCX4078190.1 hypothetical protein [Bacillus subtilis]MDK7656576.1 hypothetical protein [Bacillus subtilis]MEC0433173.1 hypothetical protein [Bacillus subtilis]WRU05126.1 hypothetical protein VDS58_18350 [Bacillus subtilis]
MNKKEMGKMLKQLATTHRSKLLEIAKRNTKRNEDGLTVIEKGDAWREDDEHSENFRSDYSETKNLVLT